MSETDSNVDVYLEVANRLGISRTEAKHRVLNLAYAKCLEDQCNPRNLNHWIEKVVKELAREVEGR
jgi:hypothetical protein